MSKMKVAIVTEAFQASTIALGGTFAEYSTVDVYIITGRKSDFGNMEAFEYQGHVWPWIKTVSSSEVKGTGFVKSPEKLRFCLASIPKRRDGVVRYVTNVYLKYLVYRLTSYDYVCVIGPSQFMADLSIRLNKCKIPHTHTLHEITDKDGTLLRIIPDLMNNKCHVIVHSEHIRKKLVNIISESSDRIHSIPFGMFLGYKDYNTENSNILLQVGGVDYILMYGFITSYKGFDVLWNAYQILKHENSLGNLKFVVAGKGRNDYVKRMKDCPDFIVINRWINNEELVTLLSHSIGVICPYKSASQSGIPQTSFLFNKPLIATNVGAFSETIMNGHNGRLVDKDRIDEIVAAIRDVVKNQKVYEKQIKSSPLPQRYNWDLIVQSYIKMIENLTHDSK